MYFDRHQHVLAQQVVKWFQQFAHRAGPAPQRGPTQFNDLTAIDMPSYGYRRVWGILCKQRRTAGLSPVNAKRLYRIMNEHNLRLLHDKPERPKREHKGKIAVAECDIRWCSDGFEFGCNNGEKLRVTFALDCCDR